MIYERALVKIYIEKLSHPNIVTHQHAVVADALMIAEEDGNFNVLVVSKLPGASQLGKIVNISMEILTAKCVLYLNSWNCLEKCCLGQATK